ncbi:MAG: pyridoxal phosphate-dependent aminotransferase, partial [Actinomycetia bacterium]|nr:pyridoxal phosphate-dependent aminotransferase [Actinomycetes bacterium]
PQWLFVAGLVRAAGGVPVEVPVFHELSQDPNFNFISLLETYITPRTRAIYFNNPDNPTGISLFRAGLQKLAEFAHIHDLWIIADNAYENYDFTSEGFTDIAKLDMAGERTFSVYTFSKMYAIPGYRVGYVLSPISMSERMRKFGLYSIYSVSTSSQFGAFQALQTPKSTLKEYHLLAKQARDIVAEQLQIPSTYAQGGIYVFLNLSKWPGNIDTFISTCIAHGVALVPGYAFGTGYDKYARLCFTATNHEGLQEAIARINRVYIHNI